MPIRCRECEATNLPHDEHCTPEELAALRLLCSDDAARNERMRTHGRRPDVVPLHESLQWAQLVEEEGGAA